VRTGSTIQASNPPEVAMIKLLVAVDGSEHARHAVEAAARLAREVAVEAILMNASEGPGYYGELPPFDYASVERAERERQGALLEAALAHARAAGLGTVRTVAARGSPAQEIARVAAENADQIVMGTRGMTPLGGLLLGSVAQRVVHLARVPVLLVK
jgi:nucleotide-binding universal stress UspA family protein